MRGTKLALMGIDFGACQLRVAVEKNGIPQILSNFDTHEHLPPLFQFESTQRAGHKHTLKWVAPLKRVLDFEQDITGPDSRKSSIHVLAKVLQVVWDECREKTGQDIGRCVVAVPPCFSQRQRSAVRTATQKAGISAVRLVDDTLAVVLAKKDDILNKGNVLVYSWGACAFSTSLFSQIEKGVRPVAQEGSMNLGGDDINTTILMMILARIQEMSNGLLSKWQLNTNVLEQLLSEAKRVRQSLAKGTDCTVHLERISNRAIPSFLRQESIPVSADLYKKIVFEMTTTTLELVNKVLESGKPCTPNVVLLSGGMTRIPQVNEAINNRFKLESVHASDADVAIGAVLYGQSLPQKEWQKAEQRSLKANWSESNQSRRKIATMESVPDASSKNLPNNHAEAQPCLVGRWAENFVPLLNEAERYYEDGKVQKSIDSFDNLFAELRRFGGELHRKAAAEKEAKGDIMEAYSILKRANQNDPSNKWVAADFAKICYARCMDLKSQGHTQDGIRIINNAIAAVERLVDEDKGYASLHARLLHSRGCLLLDLGRRSEAVDALRLCTELDPAEPQYREDLERVRSVSKGPRRKLKRRGKGKKRKHR